MKKLILFTALIVAGCSSSTSSENDDCGDLMFKIDGEGEGLTATGFIDNEIVLMEETVSAPWKSEPFQVSLNNNVKLQVAYTNGISAGITFEMNDINIGDILHIHRPEGMSGSAEVEFEYTTDTQGVACK